MTTHASHLAGSEHATLAFSREVQEAFRAVAPADELIVGLGGLFGRRIVAKVGRAAVASIFN